MFGLTPLQAGVLRWIGARIAATGVSPSFAEICAEFGMCGRGQAHNVVERLVERGHLVRVPGKARSLALSRPAIDPAEEAQRVAADPDFQAACRRYAHANGSSAAIAAAALRAAGRVGP